MNFKNKVNFLTIIDILQYRAVHQSNHIAYTFLNDGELDQVSITYQELDRQARVIASNLHCRNLTGERALLLHPPGIEFITAFFGCLYAGVVVVPAYPPRKNQKLSRLETIISDAQVTTMLTTSSLVDKIKHQFAQEGKLDAINCLATDSMVGNPIEWKQHKVLSNSLAFLQYTSGSTGTPKGVMVSHSNLLYNLTFIQKYFEDTPNSLGVSWLPHYHDMGLIAGILQPLFVGAPMTLMSPMNFLQSPFRWLQAISHYKASTSGGPNFAYNLCVRKITPEQRSILDLSRWSLAFNGAEPIGTETLDSFATAFEPCGFRREAFYPCYGLAEATLFVSGGSRVNLPIVKTIQGSELEQNRVASVSTLEHGSRTVVSCGQVPEQLRVVIVNPESLSICSSSEVGEIWVSGSSVAQGYWNQITETNRAFCAHLIDTGEGPFLRTGDLGFLENGELFVTGRLKDLVIIRGRNYYPQDIELTIEQSHPALRPNGGAVFSIEVEGEEQLIVIHEVERKFLRKLDVDQVTAVIRQAVITQHNLSVHTIVLIKPQSIPKTSSGKIQRYACRTRFLEQNLDIVVEKTICKHPNNYDLEKTDIHLATANQEEKQDLVQKILITVEQNTRQLLLESYLCQKINKLLGIPELLLKKEKPLDNLGIDSLMAVELKNQIESEIKVVIPINLFLQGYSINQLVKQVLIQLVTTDSMTLESSISVNNNDWEEIEI